MTKTNSGNFFEDFAVGQELHHATPRTVTEGDVSLYTALYGPRFALQSSDAFAYSLGLPQAPLDDLLVFHVVFGKTVPDVSLNAQANLGYAEGRFVEPVYPGDTLSTVSRVIGVRENSSGKTGVVYVQSVGRNQRDELVVDYKRWVMVNKRDPESPAPERAVPKLAEALPLAEVEVPAALDFRDFSTELSGSPHLWEDYEVGERIDHVDAMTIEDAEHQLATRLYQNTAKVHFNQRLAARTRFGRRIVYGGHIISLARALSFNGLANAVKIAAINGGLHSNPSFAGDTISAWSEIVDKAEIAGRSDVGALRVRTIALKDGESGEFPLKDEEGKYDRSVVLDMDYTVLMPRRG